MWFHSFSNHTICEHAHLSSFHPSFIYQIKQGRIYFNSIGDEFPITSLVLVEHGYNIDVTMMVMMMLAISPPSNSRIPHSSMLHVATAMHHYCHKNLFQSILLLIFFLQKLRLKMEAHDRQVRQQKTFFSGSSFHFYFHLQL